MDIIILWMNVFDVVDVIGVMYMMDEMDAMDVYIYPDFTYI